jgi:archaemetzincin
VARLVERAPPGLARARVLKEAVHEVGHTYGLVHCATPTCVMARSAALVSVDLKSDRLCAGCRARYRELQEQSRVPVHSPDPDRR